MAEINDRLRQGWFSEKVNGKKFWMVCKKSTFSKKKVTSTLWHQKSLHRLLRNGDHGTFSEPSRWDGHEYGVKLHFLRHLKEGKKHPQCDFAFISERKKKSQQGLQIICRSRKNDTAKSLASCGSNNVLLAPIGQNGELSCYFKVSTFDHMIFFYSSFFLSSPINPIHSNWFQPCPGQKKMQLWSCCCWHLCWWHLCCCEPFSLCLAPSQKLGGLKWVTGCGVQWLYYHSQIWSDWILLQWELTKKGKINKLFLLTFFQHFQL